MNLRKQNGYVGIDASVAVTIALLLMPIICGMIYNISKTNASIDRKAKAINIATNSLEVSKEIGASDLDTNLQELANNLSTRIDNSQLGDTQIESDESGNPIITFTLDVGKESYKINFKSVDYSTTENGKIDGISPGTLKTVTSTITYLVSGNEQNIQISTVVN